MGVLEPWATQSVHGFRAERRRLARARKDDEIEKLKARCAQTEAELASWQSWWRWWSWWSSAGPSGTDTAAGPHALFKESNKVFEACENRQETVVEQDQELQEQEEGSKFEADLTEEQKFDKWEQKKLTHREVVDHVLGADDGLFELCSLGHEVMQLAPSMIDDNKMDLRVFRRCLANELVGKASSVRGKKPMELVPWLQWVVQKTLAEQAMQEEHG
mmetsp:Transcript_135282/g.342298  ORF Transcript_135282/g.342298 Transcript_135282/m.342298 type:complete len:217 (+) Transcript_135282:100-750(+)